MIPRFANVTVMSSDEISIVQIPFSHPSLPIRLWGWGLYGLSFVTHDATARARPLNPITYNQSYLLLPYINSNLKLILIFSKN